MTWYLAFTKCCYSALEYEKMSTKNRALALSLLTIVMLFLMSNSGADLHPKDKTKQWLLHAGGFAGLTFAAAASTDAIIRSKYSHVRIFDETSIVASYIALWCLMGLIFFKVTIYFLVVCVAFTIVGYVVLRYLDLKNQHLNKPALSRIRDEQTRNFIEALTNSHSPAASNALATLALYAVLTSPGELTTNVLVEAATKAIGENPHAPDATAAAAATAADTDPGCCYGLFSA